MTHAPQGYLALNASAARLRWKPSLDQDGTAVAGYEVWVSNNQGGPYSKTHADLLSATEWVSEEMRWGSYFFIVTAVDKDANRSLQSNEAQIEIW